MLADFSYIKPHNLKQAIAQLAADDARIHAGGTDLLGCLRDGVFEASLVVSLSALHELRGIRQARDGGLRIGAMTTVAELAAHPRVVEHYPGLAQAASAVASPQLRNQGTVGGNLCQKPRCWYYRGEFHCLRKGGEHCYAVDGENQNHCVFGGDGCFVVHPSDTAPMLAALQAKLVVKGRGPGRSILVEDFHVPPEEDPTRETVLDADEIVTEILLPPPVPGLRSSYRKVQTRRCWDFALAGVALALNFDQERVAAARVVLSGVAPVPWRSEAVERALTGRTLDADTLSRAADAAIEDAEPMQQNHYKLPLVQALVREALENFAAG